MKRRPWRLIVDPPKSGQDNMDRDLQIMSEVGAGKSLPTLRLYRWSPPALSLGYFQKEEEIIDLAACRTLGIDVIRRPSGGRAVLHDHELTYSLIVPVSDPLINNGGVIDAYRSISRGIIIAFEQLGISASLAPEVSGQASLAPGSCFDSSSAYEIQVAGKKVVGSAQLRRNGIILQHGAILIKLPADLYAKILKRERSSLPESSQSPLVEKAAGLHDLGYRISYRQMTEALIKAFEQIIPAEFSREEQLVEVQS